MTDSRWLDPEIEGILDGDPELTELAHRVRAARPEPALDPRFQSVLRAQLMREAPTALRAPGRSERRERASRVGVIRSRRVGWWQRPGHFAWAGAGLGVALAAAAVFTVARPPQDHQVTAMSPVAQLHAVSPDNVITVAFSQPMDHAAVVSGLHIRPATEVTTAWQGNNLVITPTHHLTGNTPYTVTIDHTAARAASGQLAASDIRISFGTAAVPPSAPTVAELVAKGLGAVSNGAHLIAADDGTVIVTASTAPITPRPPSPTPSVASPSPTPSGRSKASPSASPRQNPSPSAGSSPTAGAGPSTGASPSLSTLPGEMVKVSQDGSVADLGPAASSAALSPNGLELVASVPTASGTQIVLVPSGGTSRTVLTTLQVPVLATGWLSNRATLVAEPDRIVEIDLLGSVSTLTQLPSDTSMVVFAASGGSAFAGATGRDGLLVNLLTHDSRPLAGSREQAAFSGDGSTVAWVDGTSAKPHLATSPVSRDATAMIPLNHPGDMITDLALDGSATHVAFVDHPGSGAAQLDVVALPSGSVIARGPSAQGPVFASLGDRLAFIAGGAAQTAALPGVAGGQRKNLLPDGAASALQAFVDAQVSRDASSLRSLSAPGIDALAVTPHGLSRAYVVSAVASADGSVDATARLIIDATADHSVASFADDTLTLAPSKDGAAYVVSALKVGALHDEPIGPHVVAVVPSEAGPQLVLLVSFDSDLRASTVAGAITVTRGGRTLSATTVYDADTRTATVTLGVPADTAVVVSVASSLIDVDGQTLAAPFSVEVGG